MLYDVKIIKVIDYGNTKSKNNRYRILLCPEKDIKFWNNNIQLKKETL